MRSIVFIDLEVNPQNSKVLDYGAIDFATTTKKNTQ